jgi:arylsulfatase A-like enzyme
VGRERSPRLPLYGRPDGRWAVPLDAEESRHLRLLRADAIARLDRQLASLFAALERRPEWASTWVVVTADHGEAVGEGRLFGHNCATLSQEVLHVPLIVRDPRVPERAGTRDDRPVQLVDLAPALLSAAGAAAAPGADALAAGTRQAQLALSYCNCPRLQPGAEDGPAEAIIEEGYKYVRIGSAPAQLFDLSSDPAEERDLAASQPERLERLRSALERWKRELPGSE